MDKDIKEAIRAISQLSDDILVEATDVERLPTGFEALDKVLNGGYPFGRIVELYGNEGGGKTSLCLYAIKEAQKLGLPCTFIDAEASFSKDYATQLGVNCDELILANIECGEQCFEIIEILAKAKKKGIVVVDSVANLVPRNELEKGFDKDIVGLQAKLMARGLRRITNRIAHSGLLVIFINQLRERIGVMFANPETTPGGKALKFYASIRMSVRSAERLKKTIDGKLQEVGFVCNIKCEKSKLGEPKKTAGLVMLHGQGFTTPEEYENQKGRRKK